MTDDILHRPVPAWVRGWAVATVLAVVVLLTLGGLTTSFRAGMADPVWPTEPWYLVVNGHVWKEEKAGFLLEHTHRLAGFAAGAFASVLALSLWGTERGRWRWAGLLLTLALLAVYGQFHRAMGVAWAGRQAGEATVWPAGSGTAAGVLAVALVGLAVAAVGANRPGRWVRLLGTLGLVGVMVQGLLGGYRVYLDALLGVQLAAIHGTFAQVVFCLLVATVVVAAPRRAYDTLPPDDRRRLGWLSLAVPALVFVQLVWGGWVRHTASPVAQRLHVLTAFAVTAAAVWLVARVVASPAGRRHVGFAAYHLAGIVAVQVWLGVEAWMIKFAAAGPFAAVPPEVRPITIAGGVTRTLHVLVGTALLASAVAVALRVYRKPAAAPAAAVEEPAWDTAAASAAS